MVRLAGVLVLLGMCACNRSIDVKDYDRACTVATECVPVLEGDVCVECSCGNAAIALRDKPRFDSDKSALSRSCPPMPHPPCLPCALPAVECDAGLCQLQR